MRSRSKKRINVALYTTDNLAKFAADVIMHFVVHFFSCKQAMY